MSSRADEPWGYAEEIDDIGGQVAIVGVGEAEHSKASGRTSRQIAATAVERAIEDAGLEPGDVDGIMWSGFGGDQLDDAAFHEHFGTSHDMWTSKRGGGTTMAATASVEAARALREGKAKYVVNSFAVAWATERDQMVGGPGQFHADQLFKRNLEVPFGWFPQPVYFATIARRHMHDFGTTEEQLGAIAVTFRRHANLTPGAVMHDRPLSLEKYMASPTIAAPFRKEDCCLISDGGAAYVMTTPDRARDLKQPPVTVAGVGLGTSHTGTNWAQQPAFTSTPQVFAAPGAFAMAALTPADVDLLTMYDPFTVVALMQIEDIGFCAKGEAGPFVEKQGIGVEGGALPTNTHGGMLSHSYVLGIAHVVEVVRQLRGEAAAQVEGARVGIYGGYTGPQAATMILTRS